MQRTNERYRRRAAVCLFLLMMLFLVAALRVICVAVDETLSTAAAGQSSYRLTIYRPRGTIFDTNMRSLTNNTEKTVLALLPTDAAKTTMSTVLSFAEMKDLSERLSFGKPILYECDTLPEGKGIFPVTHAVNQTEDTLAAHLIGYTDSSGHGVSGLQKAFDDLLYSEETFDFRVSCDAKGGILEFPPEFFGPIGAELSGIKLTIDANIQKLTEEATNSLRSGAVVVGEVGTGKIRALVSYPSFDPTNIAPSLSDDNAPLYNRALSAYNVGSAFKPCVAAAALEQGVFAGMNYNCTGSKKIGDKVFACHKASGHGPIYLADALAFSCNTYFYTLAAKTGANAIYRTAAALGFGQGITLADGITTERGNMPSAAQFGASEQSVANIAIGQGELMLTPINLLALYDAIAGDGSYHTPTVFEGVVTDGVVTKQAELLPSTRVMSPQTAELLRNALRRVVTDGTGKSAAPTACTAAGKTATAQTGWIRDGKAVDHSWFCGFFPAEAPRYVAVIISENTSGGGTACGPLFCALADAIYSVNLS